MPPRPELKKEQVIAAALELVRGEGLEALNARALATALGCSTQPLFRLYKSMEELRGELKEAMDRVYAEWMEAHIQNENRLVTQGVAYVEFARQEREIFRALFLNRCMAGSSLQEIAEARWNRETIENAGQVAGLPLEGAQRLFLNVWLYSHGMASQLLSNGIDLPENKVKRLHEKAFEAFAFIERMEQNGTETGRNGGVF